MNCNGNCRECTKYVKERLFRGKRYPDGEWVYGSYIWEVFRNDGDGEIRLISLSNGKGAAHVYPEILGEWTGACDSNGTKIFGGDILDYPRWIVSYATGMKCFKGMHVGWYTQRDNWESWAELLDAEESTVLGNVYDNPELWEVK